jgi:hypothetical protein
MWETPGNAILGLFRETKEEEEGNKKKKKKKMMIRET